MVDFSTVCWYCHRSDLENIGSYVKCRQCGATWNEVPKPRQFDPTKRKPRDIGTVGE